MPIVQELIRVTREFKCCAGCCWCANMQCCSYSVKVEAPVGTVIGYVKQAWVKALWLKVYAKPNVWQFYKLRRFQKRPSFYNLISVKIMPPVLMLAIHEA